MIALGFGREPERHGDAFELIAAPLERCPDCIDGVFDSDARNAELAPLTAGTRFAEWTADRRAVVHNSLMRVVRGGY